MLNVSEKLPDKSLFRRLNSIASTKDAVANDVLYHNLCWALIKQKALNKREKIEDYSTLLEDIEIIDSLKVSLRKTKIMYWIWANSMSFTKNILSENSKKYEDISKKCKNHLKNVIHENLERVVFVRTK